MPQLYENQIQFKGVEGPKASVPELKNYIGQALNNVAALSDEVSQDLQRAEDVRLKMEVDAKTKQAIDVMERADPKDFNYASALQRASEIYNSAFDGANKAAVSRFNRMNPEHATLFDLATNKVALEKSREGIYEKFKSDMDKDSSRVALGDSSREEYHKAVDATNLTNAQKQSLKDTLDKSVTDYKMFAYLSQDNLPSLKEAKKLLEGNKDMSPERRLFFAERINAKANAIQEKQKKEKSEKDSLFVDTQIETYLKIKNTKGKLVAEQYANDLAQGRIKNSDGSYTVFNTTDPSKKDYVSLSLLNNAVNQMRKSAAQTDADLVYAAQSNYKAEKILAYSKAIEEGDTSSLSKLGITDSTSSKIEMARVAADVMNSPQFNEFSSENKKKIARVAMDPYNKMNEVLGTADMLSGIRTEKGRNWLRFRTNVATYSNTIMSAASANDAGAMAKGIAAGRYALDDDFFTGEMKLTSGSNGYALANAYVAAKTLLKNSNNTEKLGIGGISNDALDRAYGAMAQALLIGGQYSADLDEEDDGSGYFDQFISAATGSEVGEEGKKTELYKTVKNALRTANKYSFWSSGTGGAVSGAPMTVAETLSGMPAVAVPADMWEIKRDNKGK